MQPRLCTSSWPAEVSPRWKPCWRCERWPRTASRSSSSHRTRTSSSALAVALPFEAASPERLPLARLADTHGVHHRIDSLVSVDADRRRARLATGGAIDYDVLVVATGAHAEPWLEGALTFGGPSDAVAYRELLSALEDGTVQHVLYATRRGRAGRCRSTSWHCRRPAGSPSTAWSARA